MMKLWLSLFASLAIAQGAHLEAKGIKTSVCHFDSVTGLYKLLSVPENALTAHMNHGDLVPGTSNGTITLDNNCNIVPNETIFAIAYINADGIPGYNATEDELIVKLVSSTASTDINDADKLVFDVSPKTFAPTAIDYAEYSNSEVPVTFLDLGEIATFGILTVNSFGNGIQFFDNSIAAPNGGEEADAIEIIDRDASNFSHSQLLANPTTSIGNGFMVASACATTNQWQCWNYETDGNGITNPSTGPVPNWLVVEIHPTGM